MQTNRLLLAQTVYIVDVKCSHNNELSWEVIESNPSSVMSPSMTTVKNCFNEFQCGSRQFLMSHAQVPRNRNWLPRRIT